MFYVLGPNFNTKQDLAYEANEFEMICLCSMRTVWDAERIDS